MIVEPGKTYIGKVRATSSERDVLALRMRLSGMLSTISLQPSGLPASAILCISRLHDPLPGSLRLRNSGMRPPYAWEQAVQAALNRLVERAAHPAHGEVPSNAEAVIFSDQAEMLACLASDWCAGNIAGRWWWQSLLRGKDIGQIPVPTWLDASEYIPAALQRLASMGRVQAFVRALSDNDARAMLRSVIRSFGLCELQFLAESPPQKHGPTAQPQEVVPAIHEQFQAERPPQAGRMPAYTPAVHEGRAAQYGTSMPENMPVRESVLRHAPWQPWVPENTGSELSLEQQCLLGVGLMLARAPAVVRSSSFARTLLRWREIASLPFASETLQMEKSISNETGPAKRQRTQSVDPVPAGDLSQVRVLAETGAGDNDVASPHMPVAINAQNTNTDNIQTRPHEAASVKPDESIERSWEPVQPPPVEPLTPLTEIPELPALMDGEHVETPGEPGRDISLKPVSDDTCPAIRQEQQAPVELLEAKIETGLGGLFYLINLGLFLNLYGDFTTPLQPGIPLSIWDFIALLGQQLLGETVRAGDDPVWLFLARLAGRGEHEPPGKDSDAPDSWHLPSEWLQPFAGKGAWRWNVHSGRLQVQHPAGFLVLDLSLEGGDPREQVNKEMQEYIGLWHPEAHLIEDSNCCEEIELLGTPPSHVERWLRWLMPYIRVRLQLALGLDSADDIARILCRHTARVILTATRLDIVLSLAALPIEVRLSGLDRDPGWVPASGRFIAFHFE